MRNILIATAIALSASACGPTERKAILENSTVGAVRTVGPGDAVMDFRLSRPLPNMLGRADLFGRTINAGRVVVRFVGSQGSHAVFERTDLTIESDATTMSQTPLIIPRTSHTTVSGVVGGRSVSASATSTEYNIIGPRPTTQVASTSAPLRFTLTAGHDVAIEGRSLRVLDVGPTSVTYRVD